MTISFRAKTTQGWTVDSPLTPFWFPGGEAHIKGVDEQEGAFAYQIADIRGADPRDLIMASMWGQAVRARGEKSVLLLPYLPAARADRGVPMLDSYVSLVADIAADQIIYLDPHSPTWVERYTDIDDIAKMTEYPFERIIKMEIQDATSDSRAQPYKGVIAPDKGARDRAARAARIMGVPVYTAGKTRDFETGRLTGFHMEDELPDHGKFLIVDDICDGGGTFVGLADAISTSNPDVKLDLWVTHGIFSKGLDDLNEHFGTIHTTDSWNYQARLLEPAIKVHSVLPYLSGMINVEL